MVALGWGAVFERGEPRISRRERRGCCAGRDDGEGVGVRADQGGKGGVGPLFANGRRLGRWIGRSTGGEGDLGVCDSHPKSFRNLDDIDITSANIDWVGSLKNPNNKKIDGTEAKRWSLDFTRASGASWQTSRMKISLGTDIESH
jgi:hypothetical protein